MNAAVESSAQRDAQNEYIDLAVLWRAAWKSRLFILIVIAVVGVASVVVTLTMPNVYVSSALLAPVSQDRQRGLQSLSSGIGALAGLAGIDLGGVEVENATLAIQTLTSRRFLTDFAKRRGLVVPLFAAERWDSANKKWIMNPEIYDEATGTWLRAVDPPAVAQPSDWEIHKAFSKLVTVQQDPKTNMVLVSVESRSPEFAKQWAEQLVADINAHMREQDLAEANRSIQYLEERLGQTTVSEMRMATFQLIEDQMKTIMLAEARPEYAFRIVDPAVVPAEKSGPKRALICVLMTFLGGMIATIFAAIFQLRIRGRC